MSTTAKSYAAPTRLGSPALYSWLAAVLASSIAIGAAAGGIVLAINSVKLLVLVLCFLAFVPGLWTAQLGHWMGVPNPRVIACGALLGGFAAGYTYLALRLFGLYGYQYLPVLPWDVALMWPSAADEWVQVDAYTDEESAASSADIHLVQLGLAVALLGSLLVNPIVAFVRAGWFDPFCAACNRWVDQPVHKLFFAPFNGIGEVVRKVRAGESIDVTQLEPVPDDVADAVEFRVYQCAGCNGPFTVSIREYRQKGEQIAKKMLLRHVTIDDEQVVELLTRVPPESVAEGVVLNDGD